MRKLKDFYKRISRFALLTFCRQHAHSTCHEYAIKMHPPVTYSLSLGFFMMLWLRLKPAIWLLHPDASAIEKIRIVFIDESLTGFGSICDLLFAMAFAANCNFTIVFCFRVGFPKMKWAEENLQILFDLEALFHSFHS